MYPNHQYQPPGTYPNQWAQQPADWNSQSAVWNAHPEQYDTGISNYQEQDANTSGCGCGNGTSGADSNNWNMPANWQPGQ